MVFLLFAIGILMGSFGSICLKVGGSNLPHFSLSLDYFLSMFSNKFVLLGFVLYFVPALIWIYLLGRFPVSFVQPILAITYVITPLLATFFLGETIPSIRWLGILIIIVGVAVVSRSN